MESLSIASLWQVAISTTQYIGGMPLPELFLQTLILIVMYQVVRMSVILSSVYFDSQKTTQTESKKYQRFKLNGDKRILIAGDSTALGTGARFPTNTIAGMLGETYPEAHIRNTAVNGALTRDILEQLESSKQSHYDVIIMSTGGNDIWSIITVKRIKKDLLAVIEKSKALSSGHVIVLFFGNVGSAPIFPRIVRYFLMKREQKVLKAFKAACLETNVHLIQLFTEELGNPFVEHPEIYFSTDKLHPNDIGYSLWHKNIIRAIWRTGYLKNHPIEIPAETPTETTRHAVETVDGIMRKR